MSKYNNDSYLIWLASSTWCHLNQALSPKSPDPFPHRGWGGLGTRLKLGPFTGKVKVQLSTLNTSRGTTYNRKTLARKRVNETGASRALPKIVVTEFWTTEQKYSNGLQLWLIYIMHTKVIVVVLITPKCMNIIIVSWLYMYIKHSPSLQPPPY